MRPDFHGYADEDGMVAPEICVPSYLQVVDFVTASTVESQALVQPRSSSGP